MKTKIAGNKLLSNIKNKRYEIESLELASEEKVANTANDLATNYDDLNDEMEIDIKDYMDKPIECLLNEVNKRSDSEKNASELELDSINDLVDLEFIGESEELDDLEEYYNDSTIRETVYYNMDTDESFSHVINIAEESSYEDALSEIQKLKMELEKQRDIIEQRENAIEELQTTLLREQENCMNEDELKNKTLTKVESLLLEKRSELAERQKASRRNWFFKILDKVKS